MPDTEANRPSPAYIPYKTFINFIKGLRENGVPNRIDRSAMHGMSGSAQAALKSSLIYLGLITADEMPTEKLTQLVDADDNSFPQLMRLILRGAYPFLLGTTLDLTRATTKQVEDAFRDQGISGSTIVKSMGFFLAAAKDAQIPISSYVKTPVSPRMPTKKQRPEMFSFTGQLPPAPAQDPPAGTQQIKLPLVGKQDVVMTLPKDFNASDWQFLQPILKAYIERLINDPGQAT